MNHQIEKQLTELQASLSHRVEAISRDFASGRSADFSEQATEQENEEVLVQLKADAEQQLVDVNHALLKLKTGDFGYCEKCGDDIATARLEALPFTRFCIQCA